ncbi:hypothetical protein EKK58_01450 [Candidatus Dependentiae bacterium]|nr:MAG: hypothetical protein EKK58_01450 [Candidatus Dependentiae bacterium]
MTKTAKNKEILQQLHDLVTKTAGAPKPVATGVPGKEPNSGAVSEKHDTVNQNAVGPESNTPQKHDQKPSTDPAKPTGGKKAEDEAAAVTETAKAADDAGTPAVAAEKVADDKNISVEANTSVEKLGRDILDMIQKFANNPVATGVPGKEPASGAVSEKHDHVDQNSVKPENNNPQSHGQKPATDPAVPVAHAKSAEEAEKAASYELGRLWGDLVIKQAYEQQLEQIKEAGRRDFEVLVAQAAEQMKSASKQTEKTAADAEKQAEAEGAAAFQNLYKQAQIEQALGQIVAQNEALAAAVAAFEKEAAAKEAEHKAALAAKQAELDRRDAEEREQQKFAQFASLIENRIMDRMRTEVLGGK